MTSYDLTHHGGLGRPAEPRAKLLQELKATRLEKVRLHRLHRLQGAVKGAPASQVPGPLAGPAPARPRHGPGSAPAAALAPARPRHGPGSAPPRGSSLNTKEVKSMRNVVTKGRGVSCPRSGGAGIDVEKRAALLPWMGCHPPLHKGGQIAPG